LRNPAGSTERGFVLYGTSNSETWNPERGTRRKITMDYSKLDGLIPAVVQDHKSGEVLMVGFMNEEAWDVTRRTGYVTFFSRTRNKLWTKGETSGNRLAVRDVLVDCDEDTVLLKAERLGDGNVCHTGERTCFFQRVEGVTIP
jgi:phosphoribosyl-AMP cyclohydrolase